MATQKNRMTHLDLVAASTRPANVAAAPQRRPIAARLAVMSAELTANVEQYRTVRDLVANSAREKIALDNLAFLNAYRESAGLEPL